MMHTVRIYWILSKIDAWFTWSNGEVKLPVFEFLFLTSIFSCFSSNLVLFKAKFFHVIMIFHGSIFRVCIYFLLPNLFRKKKYLLETIWIDDHKLNYNLISMSLKSNYDVIICTCVSYYLLFLIGWSKAGSTNENLAQPGGAKCN